MTTSSKNSPPPVERVAMGRIWWVGLGAVALAALVNGLVRALALALMDVDPGFMPLVSPAFLPLTIIGGGAGVLVYALVGWRVRRRPITVYRIVAGIALLLSFLPDLGLVGNMPGAIPATVGTLMLMHILTAAIVVGLLTTAARQA